MYEVSYVAAKHKPQSWSGLYGYRPTDENELQLKGDLLTVIALSTKTDFQLEHLGKMLFEELQESYYSSDKFVGPLAQLEAAVEAMSKKIDKIMEHEQELASSGLDLQCAISITVDDVAYVGVVGESKIVLVRDGRVIKVDPNLQDPTGKGFLRSGSFVLQPETDTLFLLTDKADALVSHKKITELAETLDLSSIKSNDTEQYTVAMIAHQDRIESIQAQQAEEQARIAEEEKLAAERAAAAAVRKPIVLEPETETEGELEIEEEVLPEPEDESFAEQPVGPVVSSKARSLSERKREQNPAEPKEHPLRKLQSKVAPAFAGVKQKVQQMQLKEKALQIKSTVGGKLASSEATNAKTYQVLIGRVIRQIQNIWSTIVKFVRKNIMGEQIGSRSVYLKGRRPARNWKLILVLVVVVGAILYTVINNAVDASNQNSLRNKATEEIAAKQTASDALIASVDTVMVGTGNEQAKLDKVNEIVNLTKEIQGVDVSKIREAQDLINKKSELVNKLNEEIDRVRGITVLKDPALVVDLSVNFQNVEASDVEYYKDNLYISDANNNAVYRVPLKGGNTTKFASDKLNRPATLTVDRNNNLIAFDEDTENSIATISLVDGSVQKSAGGLNIASLGIPRNIFAFRVGEQDRVYFLDNRTNDLKWVNRSPVGGYGSTVNTRRNDPDFGSARDLAVVDGRIYVLSPEKGVLRFYGDSRGRLVPDRYTLSGMMPDDNATSMSAMDITSKNVVLGDSTKQRIVVLSRIRNGNDAAFMDYIGQFVYRGSDDKFKKIVDLVFVEAENMIYVLDGNKVYKIQGYDS